MSSWRGGDLVVSDSAEPGRATLSGKVKTGETGVMDDAVRRRPADPPGTALTLVHEDLAELAAAMPEIAASVGPGWEALLAKLDKVLAAED